MEARLLRAVLLAASVLALGASYRTQNFIVTASTPQLAQEVGQAAEAYRAGLAREWLGRELPPWQDPCPIAVTVGAHLGAGGATSFMFDRGRPYGWTMSIQGSRERILDSVLPHEVTHTILATHFGRPLPRWADEGACTTVEHASEREKQHNLLINFLTTGRGIAFNQMFAMTEYPRDVLPLYAQGYSLARFLVAQRGKQHFIRYVGDGMQWNDWGRATQVHYGYKDLSELQLTWLDWVRRGSPSIQPPATLIAQPTAPPADAVAAAPAASDLVPISSSVSGLASEPAPAAPHVAVAAAPLAGGWYSRVRDDVKAARGVALQTTPAPGSHPALGTVAPHSIARQQPPERPQPRVLEWTREQPAAPAVPIPPVQDTQVHRAIPPLVPIPAATILR